MDVLAGGKHHNEMKGMREMSYRDLLGGPGNDCEHPVVKIDDYEDKQAGTRAVEAGCDDCGAAGFEFGKAGDTFLADQD